MADHNRVPVWPLLICWTMIAGALAVRAAFSAGTTPLILDTDDAMRLTVVHDLLGGQGWFDHVQHRLNTPFGAEIHWSRLIDVPEAALLMVFRPLFGAAADTALAYAWPLLLLGGFLWITARIALQLAGRSVLVPALMLPAGSLITMAEFAPGRLDHHGAQILLALAMLSGCIATIQHARAVLLAGLAAGIALAIGIEALPMVGATILSMGLLWVSDARHARALRDFGLSFAVVTLLAVAIGVHPSRWFVPAADAISGTFGLAALLCGLALLLLSLLRLATWRLRLLGGVVAGLGVAAVLIGTSPTLLSGPYGLLDPWLMANWIDRISEAEPWAVSFAGEPVYAVAVAIPVLTGLAVTLWNVVRLRSDRGAWLVYLVFLVVALAIMALQIRAARFAVPLATPACAVLVAAAWRKMTSSNGFGPILVALGSVVVSAGILVAVAAVLLLALVPGGDAASTDGLQDKRNACIQPAAFADLAGLPAERVMTPIDLGSHLLLYTPHSVVAAPYHRNQQGVLDTFRFFNDPIESGRQILAARGVTLVVICPAMHEIRGLVAHAPDSFVSLFAAGKLPAWLRDTTPAGSALRIYAVGR
jgi:hypothetical protein